MLCCGASTWGNSRSPDDLQTFRQVIADAAFNFVVGKTARIKSIFLQSPRGPANDRREFTLAHELRFRLCWIILTLPCHGYSRRQNRKEVNSTTPQSGICGFIFPFSNRQLGCQGFLRPQLSPMFDRPRTHPFHRAEVSQLQCPNHERRLLVSARRGAPSVSNR
jgi:hypothetical protein